ncbi:hypothetical protein [Thaumasiovibrio subtropicus]|uniref:hypothetical protein n=1 Tax=Thaumasiovibrio subtropicus TaxID=1891207 RepID=UPI000B35E753|nr:hypothetical protein [Thaumasiovibrio subtropicus]
MNNRNKLSALTVAVLAGLSLAGCNGGSATSSVTDVAGGGAAKSEVAAVQLSARFPTGDAQAAYIGDSQYINVRFYGHDLVGTVDEAMDLLDACSEQDDNYIEFMGEMIDCYQETGNGLRGGFATEVELSPSSPTALVELLPGKYRVEARIDNGNGQLRETSVSYVTFGEGDHSLKLRAMEATWTFETPMPLALLNTETSVGEEAYDWDPEEEGVQTAADVLGITNDIIGVHLPSAYTLPMPFDYGMADGDFNGPYTVLAGGYWNRGGDYALSSIFRPVMRVSDGAGDEEQLFPESDYWHDDMLITEMVPVDDGGDGTDGGDGSDGGDGGGDAVMAEDDAMMYGCDDADDLPDDMMAVGCERMSYMQWATPGWLLQQYDPDLEAEDKNEYALSLGSWGLEQRHETDTFETDESDEVYEQVIVEAILELGYAKKAIEDDEDNITEREINYEEDIRYWDSELQEWVDSGYTVAWVDTEVESTFDDEGNEVNWKDVLMNELGASENRFTDGSTITGALIEAVIVSEGTRDGSEENERTPDLYLTKMLDMLVVEDEGDGGEGDGSEGDGSEGDGSEGDGDAVVADAVCTTLSGGYVDYSSSYVYNYEEERWESGYLNRALLDEQYNYWSPLRQLQDQLDSAEENLAERNDNIAVYQQDLADLTDDNGGVDPYADYLDAVAALEAEEDSLGITEADDNLEALQEELAMLEQDYWDAVDEFGEESDEATAAAALVNAKDTEVTEANTALETLRSDNVDVLGPLEDAVDDAQMADRYWEFRTVYNNIEWEEDQAAQQQWDIDHYTMELADLHDFYDFNQDGTADVFEFGVFVEDVEVETEWMEMDVEGEEWTRWVYSVVLMEAEVRDTVDAYVEDWAAEVCVQPFTLNASDLDIDYSVSSTVGIE